MKPSAEEILAAAGFARVPLGKPPYDDPAFRHPCGMEFDDVDLRKIKSHADLVGLVYRGGFAAGAAELREKVARAWRGW